jgi:hypothetical protein
VGTFAGASEATAVGRLVVGILADGMTVVGIEGGRISGVGVEEGGTAVNVGGRVWMKQVSARRRMTSGMMRDFSFIHNSYGNLRIIYSIWQIPTGSNRRKLRREKRENFTDFF